MGLADPCDACESSHECWNYTKEPDPANPGGPWKIRGWFECWRNDEQAQEESQTSEADEGSAEEKPMSYDIYLEHDGATCMMPEVHQIAGGTRQLGGTLECWLNVTYNYSRYYYDLFPQDEGEKGIRGLYGKTAETTIPILESIIGKLIPDDGGYSYWDATEGNARRALEGLLVFAKQHPHGVWRGN